MIRMRLLLFMSSIDMKLQAQFIEKIFFLHWGHIYPTGFFPSWACSMHFLKAVFIFGTVAAIMWSVSIKRLNNLRKFFTLTPSSKKCAKSLPGTWNFEFPTLFEVRYFSWTTFSFNICRVIFWNFVLRQIWSQKINK